MRCRAEESLVASMGDSDCGSVCARETCSCESAATHSFDLVLHLRL